MMKLWLDGEDAQSFGIQIIGVTELHAALPVYKEYRIPGRVSPYRRPTGEYEPAERVLEFVCFDKHRSGAAIRRLMQTQTIRTSGEENLVYQVVPSSEARVERSGNVLKGEAAFLFESAEEYIPAVLTGTEITLENETNTLGEPRIELDASGTVTIYAGTETITVTHVNGTLVLDSRLGLIFDDDGNAWPRTTGSLPRINPGETLVISCASEMQIKPQWRWA